MQQFSLRGFFSNRESEKSLSLLFIALLHRKHWDQEVQPHLEAQQLGEADQLLTREHLDEVIWVERQKGAVMGGEAGDARIRGKSWRILGGLLVAVPQSCWVRREQKERMLVWRLGYASRRLGPQVEHKKTFISCKKKKGENVVKLKNSLRKETAKVSLKVQILKLNKTFWQ